MATYEDFVSANGLTMNVEPVGHNPNMQDEWSKTADHWKCTIRKQRRQLTIYYSMGSGYNGKKPRIENVIESLQLDAQSIAQTESFADWCQELGYTGKFDHADKVYAACIRQSAKLQKFLGDDLYLDLLKNVNSN